MNIKRRRLYVPRSNGNYLQFGISKARYHILDVKLVDRTEFFNSVAGAYKTMGVPVPATVQAATEEESAKYFVVHVRVHIRGARSFERRLRVPYGLANDELGAYKAIQKILGGFATMIKPKG